VPGMKPRPDVAAARLTRRPVPGVGRVVLVAVLLGSVFIQACIDEDPLVSVAGRGDAAAVRTLLERGSDPNRIDSSGGSAFHNAAEGGYFEVMLILYEAGADPARLTKHGDSVLTLVANHSGDVEIARWLLDHGVDPCFPPSDWISEILGLDTIVEIAANSGHDDLVVLLEQATADCPAG